jgi:hypothetical protein
LGLCLLGLWQAGAAQPPEPPSEADTPREQVTVTAPKYDAHKLEHEIVPRFVQTHSVPAPAVGQITRWRTRVCPSVTGLKPAFSDLITRRIASTARSIGALTAGSGQKCPVNIEVIFTSTPQALVDNIERQHPYLLGSARKAGDTRFTHAIQAWYLTGTQAISPPQRPVVGLNSANADRAKGDTPVEQAPGTGDAGLVPDAPYAGAAPGGVAGSWLTSGLRSELLHVLVIVDAQSLLATPMEPVADYIALVSLTRVSSRAACNELPSILDLLSESCSGRPRPTALTPADSAFLRALYSTELDMKLNIEEGEVRDRMMSILLNKP